MNKNFCISIILLTFGIVILNAQIIIRENNIVEKPVLKPQIFDSLSNILRQQRIIDYKKYIGYKVFFLPTAKKYELKKQRYSGLDTLIDYLHSDKKKQIIKTGKIPLEEVLIYKAFGNGKSLKGPVLNQYENIVQKYKNIDKEETDIYVPQFFYKSTDKTTGKIYGNIGTNPDSVQGAYFTILDIKIFKDKNYKILDEIEQVSGWGEFRFKLKKDNNLDTLYWNVSAVDLSETNQYSNTKIPFCLVPYFEKQRNLYLNQNLVLKYNNRTNLKLENLVDVNTGIILNIKYGEVWTCSDVCFIDSKDSYYLSGFYFLRNGEREVKIELGSSLISDYFLLEREFKKQELEKLKKEEEKKREELELEKKEQLAKIKFRNNCIAKWGPKTGCYIAESKVVLGMNKEMCTASWGTPIDINRTIVSGLTSEQWVYGWSTYLYFNNGVLSVIQN